MSFPHDTGKDRSASFTHTCREIIRRLSHEDILACTIYVPPIIFMAGPGAIIFNQPWLAIVVSSILGFSASSLLHRTGHRLLAALPNAPQPIYLSHTWRLPMKLTLTQWLWLLESLVGAAVLCGIVGKRLIASGEPVHIVVSLLLAAAALGLYFLPVYLGRLWIKRYYPYMALTAPTEATVATSLVWRGVSRD